MATTRIAQHAALLGLGIILTLPVQAQTRTGAPDISVFSDAQAAAIDRLIHAYIVKHPEVLLEAQSALEAQAEKRRVDVIKKVLIDNKSSIYLDPELPFIGNPKGDVILVEFFDYNCPYCRKAAPDIAKLVANDPNIKVVFHEFPNLSAASDAVANIAIAAKRQGKYYELHRALLDVKGPTSEAKAIEIAAKIGLDVGRLKQDAALPEVKQRVAKSKGVAAILHLEGTPMFLIGDRYIQGVPDTFAQDLIKLVAEVRNTGCKVC